MLKWLIILIPSILFLFLIFIIEYIRSRDKEYKCPECNHIFSPKWYDFGIFVNLGIDRHPLQCPNCKKRSPCKPHDHDA